MNFQACYMPVNTSAYIDMQIANSQLLCSQEVYMHYQLPGYIVPGLGALWDHPPSGLS